MVLESQQARRPTRSDMFAARGPNRAILAGIGGIAIVVILLSTYFLWPQDVQEDGSAATLTGADGPSSSEDPTSHDSPPSEVADGGSTRTAIIMGDRDSGESNHDSSKHQPVAESRRAAEPPTESLPNGPTQQTSLSATDRPISESSRLLQIGVEQAARGESVEARTTFTHAMEAARSGADADAVRIRAVELAQGLLFSPRVAAGDPYAETYTVKSGDSLVNIAKAYGITYPLLQRINNIVDPKRLRVGQKIKVIKGPFHAIVTKSQYRIDLYLGDLQSAGDHVLVASYRVGLGQANSTPVGDWIVRKGGKLTNPGWTNPRTGEQFKADDPLNPIGEFWIALDGTDSGTKLIQGMGIHGTIDPNSIGQQASMGCVRLGDSDIESVYNMLSEGKSTIAIRE